MRDTYDQILDVSLNTYGSARTRPDKIKQLRLNLISTADDGINLTEPSSGASSIYPYNKAETSLSGHINEIDDTPGAERLFRMHTAGTFEEIHPDGTRVMKVFGDDFYIILEDHTLVVGGKLNIVVQGDASILVAGDLTQKVKGDVNQVIHGNYNTHVMGEYNLFTQAGIQMESKADVTIKSRADLKLWAKNTAWMTATPIRMNSSSFRVPPIKDITAGLTVEESVTTPPMDALMLMKTGNDDLRGKVEEKTGPKERVPAKPS